MDDKIIAAAREAGQYADAEYQRAWDAGEGASWQQIRDARFYAIAYRQGLEDAAKVCDAKHEVRAKDGFPREASTARALSKEIRDLKKEKDHG